MMFIPPLYDGVVRPCLRHIVRGLGKCQNRSFRCRNPPRISLIARIISHETAETEFAQASFFSLLFAFRAPSETLHLRRAYRNDSLLEFTPQPDRALIGTAVVGAKRSWWKSTLTGRIFQADAFSAGRVSA